LPGLTRASISLKILAKTMACRVKPGNDVEINQA
jgi:hypothetical protein